MEQTKIEQALSLILKEGSILNDGNKFVGFLEHNYVFGYFYEGRIVIRSIDNNNEWILSYVKSCFSDIDAIESPDIREVWHEFYGRGVQITFGELPWGWTPRS